jgi:hypothetical protein
MPDRRRGVVQIASQPGSRPGLAATVRGGSRSREPNSQLTQFERLNLCFTYILAQMFAATREDTLFRIVDNKYWREDRINTF